MRDGDRLRAVTVRRAAGSLRSAAAGSSGLSVLERLVHRGASAAVTMLVAIFADPGALGAYATAMVALTALQAIGETSLRQCGVAVWNYPGAQRFLRIAARASGAGGVIGMLVVITLLGGASEGRRLFWQLLPLAVVPVASALSLRPLTMAQRDPRGWRLIARSQLLAALASLLVCGPLLPLWGVGAAAVQSLVAESVFAALMWHHRPTLEATRPATSLLRALYLPAALGNAFGWLQGQVERIVLVFLAGPHQLGLYSIASALGRSLADAVILGLVNVLRGRLAVTRSPAAKAHSLRSALLRGGVVALFVQLAVTAVTLWPVDLLLSSAWDEGVRATPMLAASAVPAAAAWSISAYLVDAERGREQVPAQVAGVALGFAVGAVAAGSLLAGAVAALLREVVAMAWRCRLVRDDLDLRTGLALILLVLLASGLAVPATLIA